MIEMMEVVIESGICPESWKGARTILICKSGDKQDLANWRPITITSIISRLVFYRSAQALHKEHENENINLCDSEQKDFIPKRAGCIEHTAIANALINNAVVGKKLVTILSLNLRDAFGSIPDDLIKMNMEEVGIPEKIGNIIMRSFQDAVIQIEAKG
jgi:hypothetical protein